MFFGTGCGIYESADIKPVWVGCGLGGSAIETSNTEIYAWQPFNTMGRGQSNEFCVYAKLRRVKLISEDLSQHM